MWVIAQSKLWFFFHRWCESWHKVNYDFFFQLLRPLHNLILPSRILISAAGYFPPHLLPCAPLTAADPLSWVDVNGGSHQIAVPLPLLPKKVQGSPGMGLQARERFCSFFFFFLQRIKNVPVSILIVHVFIRPSMAFCIVTITLQWRYSKYCILFIWCLVRH